MIKFLSYLFFSFVLFFSYPFKISGNEKTSQHPLDTHLSKIRTVDLPDMMEERYIRVLTCINRTNFFLDGAKIRGFEYSLLKEYEKSLNKRIARGSLKLTLEFVPVPRDMLINDLIAGYGDIAAAGLTITSSRDKKVDFTLPYLSNISEVPVTHKEVKTVKDIYDLSGMELFVRKSSSYFESLTDLNKRFKKEGRPLIKILEADENLETEDILEMVNSGAVKYTICDSHLAQIWSKVLPNIRVHENIKLRQGGKIAWAVREDSPLLKKDLNTFIKKHKKGTLLGNIFFDRYYRNINWIKNPLHGQSGKKSREYLPLIKKYSKQYDFDWRLIIAMGFQESGLNHKKKSNREAVGLMQIKPATAADPKVGIKDVYNVENNIHAAVKYLSFIRSRYFSDEKILPRDQVRFSLAAYNAGPAKIRRARKKAEKMRLDPNRWFRNVELAVLNTVGQETVQYVSNINKYYVIYKNSEIQ